ncbi:rab GTPase-activating protein eat-17 [Salvelinus fontinalis]|uniref:rab GTPase-activating protein eat-17 n=1 Tax=Salvelinus fontinalis TaxID=8038 RepID=UPI00248512C9|nr:rab GTPase-activating protein eat-17 [Salvelinus fontinalis]
MLSASTPTQTPPSGEDSSGSDRGSEVSVGAPATETDRFGFILGNGSTAGSEGPPPELVRQREAKWINIISQWDRVLLKKSSKVKEQCQKGIPASLRAKCWPLLCGATDRMRHNKDLYQTLDSRPALQSWVDVIERDLDRQFPFHEMFLSRDGHGQRGLFRVLKAFTQLKPEEGYCQAQGPVAAVLLMNMPTEQAFWCLVQISEQYLPGYYSPLLEGVLFDAAMLTRVLKRTCPAAHKHLQRHGVEPLMFATDWLMCLFTRHLPFNTLLRVWDLFFCYGVRVLFQVAVVLVRRALGRVEQREACEGQMETLERLRGVREQVQQEDDTFIAEVCSVPLSSKDLERQTERELEKWRMERPASTFDPRGRCHGYRMAWARVQEREEERNRKEREKGNLSLPLIRSPSLLSLSPSLLRKRWMTGSRTDIGEWQGEGREVRKVSEEVWEERSEGGNLRRRSEMDGSPVRAPGVPRPPTEDRAPVERREPLEHKEPLEQEDRRQKTQLTPDSDGEPSQQRQLTSDHSVTSQGQGEEQGGFSQTPVSEQHSDRQTQETDHSKDTMQRQEVLNKQSTASANIITVHIATETKGEAEKSKETETHAEAKTEEETAPHTHTELKTYTEAKTEEETAPHTDTELKTYTEAKTEEETAPHTDTELKTYTEAKTEEETAPHTHTELKTYTEAKTEEETAPHIDTELKTYTEAKTEEETAPHTELKTYTEAKTEEETAPHTELKTYTEAKTEGEMEAEVQKGRHTDKSVETETDMGSKETATQTDVNTDTETQTDVNTDTATQTDVNTDTETATQTDVNTDTETDTQQEADVNLEAETDTGSLTERDKGTDTDTHTDKEIQARTEIHSHKGTETHTDEKSEAERETALETHTEPERQEENESAMHIEAETDLGSQIEAETQMDKESEIQVDVYIGIETRTEKATDTNTGIETTMESPHDIQRHTETAKTEVQYTEPSSIIPANQSQVSPELTSTTEPAEERDSSEQKLPEKPQSPVTIHPGQETQKVRESEGEKASTDILPPLHQRESLTGDFPYLPDNPKSQSQSESPPPADSKADSGNSVSTQIDVSSQRTTPCDGPWATPSADFRLCKSSSSRRLTRRLSEDLFTNPNQSQPTFTQSNQSNIGFIQSNQPQPTSPIQVPKHPESPKRVTGSNPDTVPPQTGPTDTPRLFGLFRRLKGEQPRPDKEKGEHKVPIPQILIQDFSDGTGEGSTVRGEEEENLSSRERRRRRREQERREKEEDKLQKKREKELEKERKRERRKPQTRGKSFQVLHSSVPLPGNSGSQTFGSKRNSTPSMETYF